MTPDTSTFFTSPLYPAKYPSNQYCAWRIQLANGTGHFLVTVYNLYLQAGNDFLRIGEGSEISNNSTVISINYFTFPSTVSVPAPWMWILFTSDAVTRSGSGFFIRVDAVASQTGTFVLKFIEFRL